jgi:pilus assembly protein FimV
VRDYTMLFDPPVLKQAAAAPTLAQTTPAPAPVAPRAATAPAEAPAAVAARPAAPATATAPKVKADSAEAGKVTVKSGDSATKIAVRTKASDVSLDQMLVALLRSNPEAFNKGNLNRLRAGAVLDVPSPEQAKSISRDEATQTVVAQSKDFNEFRRNLAANAPKVGVEAADRKASGSIEAKVEDKKPGSSAVDKLTLSKGALQAKANEAKIAKERADKDAADRAAELAKNIADLNKLSVASGQKAAPPVANATSQPASAPALSVVAAPAAPAVAASASVVAPAASAPEVVAAPAVAAASAPETPKPAMPAPVVAEAGMLDELLQDPTLPLAAGGLIALIGGFAFYRRQQNKKLAAHVDSSFLESRLQPDSFFGASGGERVDTAQDPATASSAMSSYTNSQLGAADDVDPVAEADVYLAYGRDVQAEEILKEAALHNPGRLAIHSKLLDVYAKRGDAASFLASANKAFQLVGADTPEWARICELGLTIDPHNPLYQPGGASASAFGALEPQMSEPESAANDTVPIAAAAAEAPSSSTDLDLDLDFSADDIPTFGTPLSVSPSEETVKIQAQDVAPSNGLDFDISAPAELDYTPAESAHDASPSASVAPEMQSSAHSMDGLSLGNLDLDEPAVPSLDLPEFQITGRSSIQAAAAAAPTKSEDGMLQFDLGSLSLDLGPGADASDDAGAAPGDNSLETKLALAEEFVSIGDQDGARALIEEVVAEATGDLREKAQRALAKLS